jgi:hypothetical protein
MNAVMFDPRYIESIALDSRTLNQTAEPASTKPSRRPLVCRWGHTAEGRLACTWRQMGLDDAGDPPWREPCRTASPEMKSAPETRKSNRRPEMTRLRALEIEACVLSTMGGAIDAPPPALRSVRKFATPSQTLSRAQAVTKWIAIALLLAGAGLELVLCFTVGSSGPL